MPNSPACFVLHPQLIRDNAWLQQRRRLLAAQLLQHQADICIRVRRYYRESLALPEEMDWLHQQYSAWAASMTEAGEDIFLRWRNLPDTWAEFERQRALAWAFLDISQAQLSDADVFLCREQLRTAEYNVLCRNQADKFNQQAEQFCATISEAFQQSRLDFNDENGRAPALEGLSWDLALLFQDWRGSGNDSISLSVGFVDLFCRQIVARYNAAPRFWELLLIKLERALCAELSNACLQHVLTPAIEALLGAVPRYPFIHAYLQHVDPVYKTSPLPCGNILLWQMIGSSRPQGVFYQNLLRSCIIDVRVAQLPDGHAFAAQLKDAHHSGEETLRTTWERAQLDWYSDACAWLDRQVQNAHELPALVAHCETQLDAISSRLSEGFADAESDLRLRHMLGCLLDIVCLTATLDPNPQLGRGRLRYHLALFISPDAHWPLWRKHQEMVAGLRRLSVTNEGLWQQAMPLLNILDNLLLGLCRDPLRVPEDLSAPPGNPLPLTLLQDLLDMQHLYPRYLRRRYVVRDLLALPAHIDSATLKVSIQAWQTATPDNMPGLAQCWEDLLADLPLLLGLSKVLPEVQAIAAQGTQMVRDQVPEYVASVGEIGMSFCAEDNAFMLQRVAQVLLGSYLDPQEALLWWWETSVGSYLVHRDHAGMGANLRGLRSALEQRLHDDVGVQTLFLPLHKVYNEVVGSDVLLSVPSATPVFVSLPLQGERQRKLTQLAGPLPVYLDDFTACAEKYQRGGAPQGPLCLDLGSDQLAQPLQEQLQSLLHIYLVEGDLEMALQNVLVTIDGAFRDYSTEELEIAWRQLLALLPEALPLPRSSYWSSVFQQALDTLRQAGLGRYLETHADELGERLEAFIGHLTEFTDADRHRYYLSELCRHLGRILRRQPATLAALNSGRYVIEQAMPQLNYPAPVWHVLWQRLSALCLPELDNSERLALHLWINQWDVQCHELPNIQHLSQGVFGSEEFVFAENPQDEQAWRGVLSGLLAAALTPDDAPIPGGVLSQRLVLSSPVFASETAASWQSRYAAMQNAFISQLPGYLRRALDQQHVHVSNLLLRLPLLENLDHLPRINRFILALSRWPLNRLLWGFGCLIQSSETPRFKMNSQDYFLARNAGWACVDEDTLKGLADTYQAACLYRPDKALASLTSAAQEEFDIALRMAALANFHPDPERSLQRWLFEMIPQLEADNLGHATQMMDAWLAQLRQQEPNPLLQELAVHVRSAWDSASLAHQLAYDSERMAQQIMAKAQPKLSEAQASTCTRDLGFVAHYLGLYLGGMDQGRSPARWYWQHVACFLPPAVRDEVRDLFPRLATCFSDINDTQRKVLEGLQAELVRVCDLPEWTQVAAYRVGKSDSFSGAVLNSSLRTFTSLGYQGPRWDTLFSQTQPDPRLLEPLQNASLWPEKLQNPPLYVANMVSAQLATFLAALHSVGGDEEIAWQAVMPMFDEALQQVPAQTLCRAWQALAMRLPELLGEPASVYWHGVFSRGEEILQQVALGRLLSRHGEDAAAHIGEHFMVKMGNPDHTYKCQRDQGLFLDQMAAALRSQAPTLAALNISRYLLEMVIPFVSYSSTTWRLVWMRLEQHLRQHVDAAEYMALQRWIEQLSLLMEHLPPTRPLGRAVFHAEAPCFSEDPLEEQHWQMTFSALLCAALTPEDAPLPGQALVQRLVLSSPVFAEESGDSWQARQQQLTALSQEHLAKPLQVPLLVRHSQIIASLMKLPRLQDVQEGLSCFAGALSGLHYAEALWRSLQWAHMLGDTDYSPGMAEVLVNQATGWSLCSPDSLRRAADTYHAAGSFSANFKVIWHKWRLGGLLGRIDSDSLTLTAEQKQVVELFLARLVLQHLPGLPEHTIKRHVFMLFSAFGDYLPEQREALLYHLQQAVIRNYGEGHPLSVQVNALSNCQAEVGTALILLHNSEHLLTEWLPEYPQCAEDLSFLLRRIGLHLSGLAPCRSIGDWYWRQIGVFLNDAAFRQARPVFNELLKALPKHLPASHAKCLEPLIQEVLHGLAGKTPTQDISAVWKVHL